MPKENTHLWIANKVFENIENKEVKGIIESYRGEYNLGSVAPDILLYSYKTADIARKLHGKYNQKTNKIVFDLLKNKVSYQNDQNLAFILGYLTHCSADSNFHPAIEYFSKINPGDTEYNHQHLETKLDTQLNKSFSIEKDIDKSLIDELDFLKIISTKENIPLKNLKKVFNRWVFANKAFRNNTLYHLVHFFRGNKGPSGLFYASADKDNQSLDSQLIFADSRGIIKKTSIEALVKKTIAESTEMIDAAYDFYKGELSRQDCEKIISGKNLNTGELVSA